MIISNILILVNITDYVHKIKIITAKHMKQWFNKQLYVQIIPIGFCNNVETCQRYKIITVL